MAFLRFPACSNAIARCSGDCALTGGMRADDGDGDDDDDDVVGLPNAGAPPDDVGRPNAGAPPDDTGRPKAGAGAAPVVGLPKAGGGVGRGPLALTGRPNA